jgi:hypothetical protein
MRNNPHYPRLNIVCDGPEKMVTVLISHINGDVHNYVVTLRNLVSVQVPILLITVLPRSPYHPNQHDNLTRPISRMTLPCGP